MLSSCNDYLIEDSGDLLIPTKVEEFASVLYGEGYPSKLTDDTEWMQLLSDDAECMNKIRRPAQNSQGDDEVFLATGRGAFCWKQDIEYYIAQYANAYQNAYSNINACNICLENWQTCEGDYVARCELAAQAYALRAYAYFCLANWYGEPYVPATADSAMGVVIRLDSRVVRDQPQRATLAQVYQRINTDLDSALILFDIAPKQTNVYKMNKKAVLLLKSRVALYQQKWDDVIRYGEQLMTKNKWDISTISTKTNTQLSNDEDYYFISAASPETVWMFGGRPSSAGYNSYFYNGRLIDGAAFAPSQTVSGGLYQSYETGDNRVYAFFSQDGENCNRYTPYKYWSWDEYSQALRIPEAMLNVAEAYVQKGNISAALSLVNDLRRNRIRRSRFVEKTQDDFATQEEALDFVREERRRELCFEETHRWWDLRRYGCPELKHTFYATASATPEVYILQKNDRNYTLELPKSELRYNKEITPLNRRVIEAE